MYNFNEKNIEMVKKFIDIKNKGLYMSSKMLADVYNEVLNKNRQPSSCGTCMRGMVSELERALNVWEAEERKAAKKAEEEAKNIDDTNNKEPETDNVTPEKKKRGRPTKVKEK